ncbi:MAG: hypothetical protein AB7G28_07005 [Pirellulales bacterium]
MLENAVLAMLPAAAGLFAACCWLSKNSLCAARGAGECDLALNAGIDHGWPHLSLAGREIISVLFVFVWRHGTWHGATHRAGPPGGGRLALAILLGTPHRAGPDSEGGCDLSRWKSDDCWPSP